MPSIKMLTTGAPGTDQFGPIDAGLGFDSAVQLGAWNHEALAPHLRGYMQAHQNATAAHRRRVNEAARLWADVVSGRVEPIFLREAQNPRNPFLVDYLRNAYPGLYKVNGRCV